MLKIIVAAYNCRRYIHKCLSSIKKQTYKDYEVLVIDDCSSDGTGDIAANYFMTIKNKKHRGALYNQVAGIDFLKHEDEDIIIIVDGDDWLYDSDSFNHLAKVYKDPNVWLTYGNYITWPKSFKSLCEPIPDNYNFRTGPWLFSHLRTFKFFLFKNLSTRDFCYTGTNTWYPYSSDIALMRPMTELAGRKHIKFIPNILLVYNMENPLLDQKINEKEQLICEKDVVAKNPYTIKTKEELC